MEVLFKSDCELNTLEQKEVLKILSIKNIVTILILAAFMVIIGAISLLTIISGYNSIKLVVGIVMILCGAAYVFLAFYNYKKAMKQVKDNVKYSYHFYEDRIEVSYVASAADANQTFMYEELKKFVKKEKYTLIYIEKNRAMPLKNEAISDELFDFLRTKIR